MKDQWHANIFEIPIKTGTSTGKKVQNVEKIKCCLFSEGSRLTQDGR